MTWRDYMAKAGKMLADSGIEDWESDVRLLAMHVLGCDYTALLMRSTQEPTAEEMREFSRLIELRKTHMPCQYIIGSQEFMGYEFLTRQEVLIPRPETELLVEKALKLAKEPSMKKNLRVLDLCCGTGCIGISFSLMRRGQGFAGDEIFLADISEHAVRLAEENNSRLQGNCKIIQSDLFENIEGSFDMILSNPPYIPTADCEKLMRDVRDFEPRLALDGRENGLYFYDRIIKEAREFLSGNGKLLFEIGYNQLHDVHDLLVDAGYGKIQGMKDYAGHNRVVCGSRS